MQTFSVTNARTWLRETGRSAMIVLITGMLALTVRPGQASERTERMRPVADTTAPVVRRVDIRGNRHFSDGTLKRNIRTRPNRRILGIPGFTWWRWVYQLGSADWMWDRLGSALKSGGEPPAYLDSTTIGADAERLQLFYQQRGFREAAVSYEVQSRQPSEADEVRVVFEVEPGPATYLRRVRYAGLDSLRTAQKRRLLRGTVFEASSISLGDTLRISVQNQRYQEPKLLEERRRILSFLQNEGYAAVSRDSVRAVVYRVAPDSFDVTLRVRTGPRYRFGDVHFKATGVETAPPRSDTLDVVVDTTGGYRPQVTVRIDDNDHLDPSILRRSLQFRPGEYYDRAAVQATKRRLENTGVFAFTDLSPQYDAAIRVDTTAYLPIRIEGRTRQRHRVEAETFALQRESVGGTDTGLPLNEFGVGLSGVYENVNALGGGETFRLRASGSVATGLDSTLVSSNQFEGGVSLILPYLVRPFRSLTQSLDLVNARTRISLTALTALRSDLGLRIRSRVNANLRLEMDHTPTRSSLVDVVDVSVSNPDTLDQFSTKFLDRVFGPGGGELQDPVQRQQILEDYTQPQVNTALRYTFRAATANPLRRRSGHIYEASAEVGNTLPLLFDRFVFAPDTLAYSLPSLFGEAGGLTGRLLYRPYVRASVDLRRYVPLGPGTTLGMKLFGGMAHPTARPTVVPFDRRFFSGGANSVRGWRLRELGPGEGLPFDTTASVQGRPSNILGGDVKLESSVELRTTLIQNFLAARWAGATFLDAGNVWFGPRNPGFGGGESSSEEGQQDGGTATRNGARDGHFRGLESLLDVGVGGGVGLRIEWQYLIVRFDLAYRLHDPSPRNNDVFADDFNGPLLHFGIGQAF